MFDEYHEEYRALNAGAHRKSGIEVDTPTLTRHVALWFPVKRSTPDAPRALRRSMRDNGAIVDAYIQALYKRFRDEPGFETNAHIPCPDPACRGGRHHAIVLFGGAYRYGGGAFDHHPTENSAIIREVFESDSRILFLKATWRGLRVQVRFEAQSEYFSLTTFLTLPTDPGSDATATTLQRHLSILPVMTVQASGDPPCEKRLRDAHRYVFHELWDDFFEEIRLAGGGSPLKIFADFRGLVVRGTGSQDPEAPCIDTASIKTGGDRGLPFDEDWARERVVGAVWPFVDCDRDPEAGDREFTASYMLRRRAIYLTDLGPQPVVDPERSCRPLHYLLVARPANDWQLGGLVDRLHYMGTVRLAGLMELSGLRLAGMNLKAVESSVDGARDALRAEKFDEALKCVAEINRLISHRRRGGKESLFQSGLQFRVERSRFYVSRFAANEKFLRIERIEGYQPYHQFIESRLGGVYEYVDRLGTRQERALRGASGILQEIQNGQTAIQNRQARSLIEDIESIQFKAELALLAVLLPYYGIATIDHICVASGACDPMRKAQLFLAIGIACPILALANFGWHIWRHRGEGRHLLSQAFVVCVLVLAMFAAIFGGAWAWGFGRHAPAAEGAATLIQGTDGLPKG